MIYESVNLKGGQKLNSFSLQSVTTCTGFPNVGPIFCEDHSLSSEQVFYSIIRFSELIFLINVHALKDLLFSEDFYQRFD